MIAMSAGLFVSGISLGAFLENKRLHSVGIIKEVRESLKDTREILLPLADKITHHDNMRNKQFLNYTLVDYNKEKDPEITLEMPVYEQESITGELNLKEEQWLKRQGNWED